MTSLMSVMFPLWSRNVYPVYNKHNQMQQNYNDPHIMMISYQDQCYRILKPLFINLHTAYAFV